MRGVGERKKKERWWQKIEQEKNKIDKEQKKIKLERKFNETMMISMVEWEEVGGLRKGCTSGK